MGRFKAVKKTLERYLSRMPEDPTAHYLIGEMFRQKGEEGDGEKAKKNYLKAIALDLDYPDPHKSLGMIYFKEGERKTAAHYFARYLFLAPAAQDRTYIEESMKACTEGGNK